MVSRLDTLKVVFEKRNELFMKSTYLGFQECRHHECNFGCAKFCLLTSVTIRPFW